MTRILVNNKDVKITTFSGGELNVTIPERDANIANFDVYAELTTPCGLFSLALVKNAIEQKYGTDIYVCLHLPYLPYSRQDRVCNSNEAFSLLVACNFINSMNFKHVAISDIHSKVGEALIDNLQHRDALQVFSTLRTRLPTNNSMAVVAPDEGARHKIERIATHFNLKSFYAKKTRDPRTGEITNMTFSGDVSGKDLIVVDDICDGGRTFIALAKELKSAGAGDLYLLVTHGIFSYGKEELNKYYKEIHSENNFWNFN